MSLRRRGAVYQWLKWTGVLVLGMAIGAGSGFGYHFWQKATTVQVKPVEKKQIITVSRSVQMGETLSEQDLTEMEIEEGQVPLGAFTSRSEAIGKKAWTNLTPKAVLSQDYFFQENTEFMQNTQEVVFDKLPEGLEDGDYIDVRIQFPSGHDYCVLSHKQVFRVNYELNKVAFGMSEEERVRFGSAKTDVATFDTAYLYISIYPKGVDMPNTIVRYPVNGSVKKLYEDVAGSNVISNERSHLEVALQQLKEEEKFLKSADAQETAGQDQNIPSAEGTAGTNDKNLEKFKTDEQQPESKPAEEPKTAEKEEKSKPEVTKLPAAEEKQEGKKAEESTVDNNF